MSFDLDDFDDPSPPTLSGINTPGSSVFDIPVQGFDLIESLATPPSRDNNGPTLLSSSRGRAGTLTAPSKPSPPGGSFVVISGGTGCNSICAAFGDACYVLPVSDDGGSSSEIIRVLGGPSIGDIRSRLIRLIPTTPEGSPLDKIRNLLAYRLASKTSEREARDEWRDIVEGRSFLWDGIPADRKELIRGFFVYFEGEVLRRAQKGFCFRNGSVGNYFLAAAQSFFRSLPSAIFLFSSITGSQAYILPILITNHTVTIAAELENGSTVVGQCNISHPVRPDPSGPARSLAALDPGESVFKAQNFMFAKDTQDMSEPLEADIKRLFYINSYGHEIHPTPNPQFIANLASSDTLVYSCGSLWTSVVPCLALRGVAPAIAQSRTLNAKILFLNSKNDRETGGYTAVDYIRVIARALNAQETTRQPFPASAFVTHLVHLKHGSVVVDRELLASMGIQSIEVEANSGQGEIPMFDAGCVTRALQIIKRQERRGR